MTTITNILDVEQHLDGVEAVIFDLDDTLYSEKAYIRSGYQQISAHFRIPTMEEEMWAVFEQGGMAIDEVLTSHDLIKKKEEAIGIYRFQEPHIHLYDGAADMIARIRKTKKVGIITDGRPEGQRAKLKALGLSADAVIITDELGGAEYRKPCTLAFQMMQQVFDVPFEKMVYIGDNTKKDFIAPEKLGMKWIWFDNGDGIYKSKPD